MKEPKDIIDMPETGDERGDWAQQSLLSGANSLRWIMALMIVNALHSIILIMQVYALREHPAAMLMLIAMFSLSVWGAINCHWRIRDTKRNYLK